MQSLSSVLAAALMTFGLLQSQLSFAQTAGAASSAKSVVSTPSTSSVAPAPSAAPTDTELTLEITEVESDQGQLLIAVHNDPNAFPRDGKKAVLLKTVIAQKGSVQVVMGKLKPGIYAVSFMHDENGDGKMGTNFLGIPKEGFGFSNDPTITFGPPSFDRAKIEIKGPTILIRMKTKYF